MESGSSPGRARRLAVALAPPAAVIAFAIPQVVSADTRSASLRVSVEVVDACQADSRGGGGPGAARCEGGAKPAVALERASAAGAPVATAAAAAAAPVHRETEGAEAGVRYVTVIY